MEAEIDGLPLQGRERRQQATGKALCVEDSDGSSVRRVPA